MAGWMEDVCGLHTTVMRIWSGLSAQRCCCGRLEVVKKRMGMGTAKNHTDVGVKRNFLISIQTWLQNGFDTSHKAKSGRDWLNWLRLLNCLWIDSPFRHHSSVPAQLHTGSNWRRPTSSARISRQTKVDRKSPETITYVNTKLCTQPIYLLTVDMKLTDELRITAWTVVGE